MIDKAWRLFIAEDEPPARERLIEALGRVAPQARVAGHADSVAATARWLAANPPPDLLLLDIQLADGLSLELFRAGNALLPRALVERLPVIFTTAYDRFAVQAFQALAVDYLLKPVRDDALAQALARAQRLGLEQGPADRAIAELLQRLGAATAPTPAAPPRLLGRQGAQMRPLALDELAYIVSLDKVSIAVALDGRRFTLEQALAELEARLPPAQWFRASRQMLLSVRAVRGFSAAGRGRLKLQLSPAAAGELLVSQERAGAFKAWLGG